MAEQHRKQHYFLLGRCGFKYLVYTCLFSLLMYVQYSTVKDEQLRRATMPDFSNGLWQWLKLPSSY